MSQAKLATASSPQLERTDSAEHASEDEALLTARRNGEETSCPDRRSPLSLILAPFVKTRLFVWHSGVASIAVASVIMGFNALLVKMVVDRVPTLEIVVARGALCWLMSITVAAIQGSPTWYGQRVNYPALLVRGTTGTLSMSAYYMAMHFLPLADTITIFFFNPALTCLLAWALLGEAMGLLGVAGVGFSLVGVALVSQPPFLFGGGDDAAWTSDHLIGVGLALFGALMSSCAFVSIKYVTKGESSLSIALWFHTCSIFMGIVPLMLGWPRAAVVPEPMEALLIVTIGVTSFLGQILLGRGYQLEAASKIAVVNYTQVLSASFFGMVVLGERLPLVGWLGSALIACGVCLASMRKTAAAAPAANAAADESPAKAVQFAALPVSETGDRTGVSGHVFVSQWAGRDEEEGLGFVGKGLGGEDR